MNALAPRLARAYLTVLHSAPVQRSLIAAGVPRLRLEGSPATAAARRALVAAALGRTTSGEQRWSERIEAWRAELNTEAPARDQPLVVPYGARPGQEPVGIAAASIFLSIPPLWGRLLMRLIREQRPRSCLELGTGLGVSAAYQAAALELNGAGRLVTIDVERRWGAVAKRGLAELGLGYRIEQRFGTIAETLEGELVRAAPVDYAFVDAEHQGGPTFTYFESMLPHLSDHALLVFDDIGFSRGMIRAWAAIRRHPRVAATAGLGRIGIVALAPG